MILNCHLDGVWIQRHIPLGENPTQATIAEMMADYRAQGGTGPARCWVDEPRRLLLIGPDIGDVPWPILAPKEGKKAGDQ